MPGERLQARRLRYRGSGDSGKPRCGPIPERWPQFLRRRHAVGQATMAHRFSAHALVELDGKVYLLRAMVNETANPTVVVTVYRTSKIEKYGSQT